MLPRAPNPHSSMADATSPTGRYDTAIALAVVALFGVFLYGYIADDGDDTDEFRIERAGIGADDDEGDDYGYTGDHDASVEDRDYVTERRVEARVEEAYQQGVQDAERVYENELRVLRRQLREYEALLREADAIIVR